MTAVVVVEALLEIRDSLRQLWTGTDEAHRPGHHEPELRQLVDMESPQHSADTGDELLLRDTRIAQRIGIGSQRTQLDQLDLLSVLADSPLPVQDRPSVR